MLFNLKIISIKLWNFYFSHTPDCSEVIAHIYLRSNPTILHTRNSKVGCRKFVYRRSIVVFAVFYFAKKINNKKSRIFDWTSVLKTNSKRTKFKITFNVSMPFPVQKNNMKKFIIAKYLAIAFLFSMGFLLCFCSYCYYAGVY